MKQPVFLCTCIFLLITASLHALPGLDESLIYSVRQKSISRVQKALREGANPNTKNDRGQSALHLAVKEQSKEIISILLKKGADINIKNRRGETPLIYACQRASNDRNVNIIQFLIMAGADLRQIDKDGQTALHVAVRQGDSPVLKLLIEKGAPLNSKDLKGRTPLFHAAGLKAVQRLTWAGAKLTAVDYDGNTLLHIDRRNDLRVPAYIIKKKVDVNIRNKKGETPLYSACVYPWKEAAALYIKNGADVTVADRQGNSPLIVACNRGDKDIAKMLIGAGADINKKNLQRNTPLHFAAGRGSSEIIKLLVKQGVKLNIQNNKGMTALHTAAINRNRQCLELLIDAGADMSLKNKEGNTPLHEAVKQYGRSLAKYLLDHGAPLNVQNKRGQTPLHLCFGKYVNRDVVGLLVEKGANLSLQDIDGNTPLHLAVKKGKTWAVKILLEKGASTGVQNNLGDTPLTVTEIIDYDILKLLLERGASVVKNESYFRKNLRKFVERPKTVKLLVKHGLSVNFRDEKGFPLIYSVLVYNKMELARWLVREGANIQAKSKYGATLVFAAAESCSGRSLAYMEKQGADFTVTDNSGKNPLHYAAAVCRGKGAITVFDFLTKKKVPLDAKDKDGNTPLHIAVMNDSVSAIEILRKKGVSLHLKNRAGLTPVMIARQQKDAIHLKQALFLTAEGVSPIGKAVKKIFDTLGKISRFSGRDHLGYIRSAREYISRWHLARDNFNSWAGEGQRRAFDMFSLASGGTAIRESLQLETIGPAAQKEKGKEIKYVSLSSLKGPEIESHPFDKMRKGVKWKASALSRIVPEEFYYLHSTSLKKILQIAEYLGERGGTIYRRYSFSSVDYRLKEKYMTQLALKENTWARNFYDRVISEFVICGSAPFLRSGTDFSLIFKMKRPGIFKPTLENYRVDYMKRHRARRIMVNIEGLSCDYIFNETRRVNSYLVFLKGNIAVLSNSRAAVERIIRTYRGQKKSLYDAPDFRYFRAFHPMEKKKVFLYLSDSFVRYLTGPSLRLGEARRMKRASLLSELEMMALLYFQLKGKSAPNIDELFRGLSPRGLEEEHVRHFKRRFPAMALGKNGLTGVDKKFGSFGYMKSNLSHEIEKVTEDEAEMYKEFARRYHDFWRRYFDPIGITLSLENKKMKAVTHILPLIDSSMYRTMSALIGGVPAVLPADSDIKGDIMTAVFKMTPVMKDQLLGLLSMEGKGIDSSSFDTILGDYCQLHVMDSRPAIDFDAGRAYRTLSAGGRGVSSGMAYYMFMGWSLFHPLRISIPIKDITKKKAFSEYLDRSLPFVAGKNYGGFLRKQIETYSFIYKGKKVRVLKLSLMGILNFRIFYYIDSAVHVSTSEYYIKRLIDVRADSARTRKTRKQNLIVRFRPSQTFLERELFAANMREDLMKASLSNLGTMELLKVLFPKEKDLYKKSFSVFAFTPVCPAGGTYTYNKKTGHFESSLFGTVRQPVMVLSVIEKKVVEPLMNIKNIEVSMRFSETGIIAELLIE